MSRLCSIVAVLLAVSACSGGSSGKSGDAATSGNGGTPGGGSGASSGASSGANNGASSGNDSGPVAPYGIDARPANPSCVAPARPTLGKGVALANAFGSATFSRPTGIFQAPGDKTTLYVIEQGGSIKRVPNNPSASNADVKEVFKQSVTMESGYDERGLLGLAFHPNFQQNGYVYLSYVANDGGDTSFIDRLTIPTDNTVASWGTPARLNILKLKQPFGNHNGGNIAFDQAGYLFIGFGDGGSGGDPGNRGQNKNELLGKLLRIDVDKGSPYAIPDSNPFKNGGGKPEIYAWGFRNPWRYSFDRETGELWVADVGQNCSEEIDLVELGKNYGWNDKEGHYCFNKNNPDDCGKTSCSFGDHVDPVFDYMHDGKVGAVDPFIGASITGGFVYRGKAIPALVGTYLYGDYGSNNLFGLQKKGAGYEPLVVLDAGGVISTFGEDADGEIYLALYKESGASVIKKVVASNTPAQDTLPKLLSQTGCVDANDATKMAGGLIPYDINVGFWSDGAKKERWLAIPDGTKLSIDAEGDVELPPGGVTVKTFWIGDKRVETRFFVRYADGSYGGYTYAWNDAQTDATLLDGSLKKTVGNQSWYYPARGECNKCHNDAVKGSIGLEALQLDRAVNYGSTRADQLGTLEHIGFFADKVTRPSPALARVEDTSVPLEARARAYLHANCSNCHRPNGPGRGTADLRFTTADPKICNADAQEGTLGIAGAKLLVPGNTDKSLVYQRMGRRSAGQMPPLASSVVDEPGRSLLEQWIRAKTACP